MKEVLKLALEALETCYSSETSMYRNFDKEKADNAITAIKEALAQPQPEPVANVVLRDGSPTLLRESDVKLTDERLYTIQPQRTWIGLTESDRRLINFQWQDGNGTAAEIIDLVEAKFKDKNK